MVDAAVGDVVAGPVTAEDPVGFLGEEFGQAVDLGQQGVVGVFGQ